jgi:chromosome segregation ATPase
MSWSESPDSITELIDSAAAGVPDHLRAAYYRDMRYLHTLSESDEMLRILKTIQWNSVIALQVPARIAAEVGKLDRSLRDNVTALQQVHQRLDRLSDELVGRVSAEAIANQLYESLRQQFVKSTIPETGKALTVAAGQIKQVVTGLDQVTPKIIAAHKYAASEAQHAIRDMKSEISAVTATARQATTELSSTFLHEYRWALGVLLVFAALLGFCLGILAVRSGYWPK